MAKTKRLMSKTVRAVKRGRETTQGFLAGHQHFRSNFFQERTFLKRLAVEGQTPKALYIGCSDSRVVPEYLTHAGVGDLFVVRNIANHVPKRRAKDLSVGAAIEYAVTVLKVKDIIVCGHYGCGGVKAAIDGLDALTKQVELKTWLKDLVDSVDKAKASGLTGDALFRRAVEEHVLDALDDLISFSCVREVLDAGTVHVHGWVYDLHSTQLMVFDADTDAWVDALKLQK
ncbi:MAG: carbonic anhydrase [Archangiaceae bacterium]|nr:carbonic anhydrase [Archangiaceae bacterium]